MSDLMDLLREVSRQYWITPAGIGVWMISVARGADRIDHRVNWYARAALAFLVAAYFGLAGGEWKDNVIVALLAVALERPACWILRQIVVARDVSGTANDSPASQPSGRDPGAES